MKKIKTLKLSELSKDDLTKRQMKALKGGSDYCKLYCGTISPPYGSTAEYWQQYY